MATGNYRGPLGPVMLVGLFCLCGFMAYAVLFPEATEQFTFVRNNTPSFLFDKTIVSLVCGSVFVLLGTLFFRRR
ncbi:MAG: hypothetical protein ABJN26_26055 [Stappiaceae bacterium]